MIVKHALPRQIQGTYRGLANPVRLALFSILLLPWLTACHKDTKAAENGITPTDPQVAANLADLSHQLRRALPHYRLTGSFDEFATTAHITVPPPPAGQKYAINKQWKVILVDAK
jgi:hypothetical protein